jgi:ferredoxin
VLPVQQSLFSGNLLIALVFVAVIALNRLADRFWCRYLCPLGALLALFARVSLLRPFVGDACTRCGRCATVCQLGAIDSGDRVRPKPPESRTCSGIPQPPCESRGLPQVEDSANTRGDAYRINPAECTVCLDCLADCPRAEVGFRLALRLPGEWPALAQPHDPRRRQVLAALATGAAGVVVMRTGVAAQRPDPQLIRPPGAQDEAEFLSRCLRCSQCMRVCPTAGLQPALGESGLEGLWTPRLVSRLGYCNYGCNACGQVCPSHAIPALDLATKRRAVLGVAGIDRNRCLPWAQGTPCIVCEEMCPLSPKAIRLEEVAVTDTHGQAATPLRKQGTTAVQRPHVLSDRCIGCGICEYQCPISGAAAIQVYRA